MEFKSFSQKFVFAITGGGSGFLSGVLKAGGGSEFLLEATIPYDHLSLENYVGGVREKPCSDSTARQLAVAAEARGEALGQPCIGVGASCALLKENERSGREHKIFVAVKHKEYCVSVEWQGNLGSREGEENLASNLISYLSSGFARYIYNRKHSIVCDFRKTTDMTYIFGAEIKSGLKMNYPSYFAMDAISYCQCGFPAFYSPDVYTAFKESVRPCIYPGSFSFVHDDHISIFKKAEELYGEKNCFCELSITNFRKPNIDSIEVSKRIKQMRKMSKNILITSAPRMVDKLKTFNKKEVVFAVGHDTFERVEKIDGASFFVFPRNGNRVSNEKTYLNKIEIESFSLQEGQNLSSSVILKS